MKENTKILVKASIAFAIGIGGLTYLRCSPTPATIEPKVIHVTDYTFKDVDNNGTVDYILGQRGNRYANPDKLPELKKQDTFIDYMGFTPAPIPADLQEAANEVLNGNPNTSELER